jgi:hypothetical protein
MVQGGDSARTCGLPLAQSISIADFGLAGFVFKIDFAAGALIASLIACNTALCGFAFYGLDRLGKKTENTPAEMAEKIMCNPKT